MGSRKNALLATVQKKLLTSEKGFIVTLARTSDVTNAKTCSNLNVKRSKKRKMIFEKYFFPQDILQTASCFTI